MIYFSEHISLDKLLMFHREMCFDIMSTHLFKDQVFTKIVEVDTWAATYDEKLKYAVEGYSNSQLFDVISMVKGLIMLS